MSEITQQQNIDGEYRRNVASMLECSVCLSLLCEPISISCGHTFCRVCLVKSLRRHKKQCPSCREVCHVSPEIAQENIILKNLALQVDFNLYQQRSAETAVEKESWAAVYPVFFYNQLLLPGSKLRLHLFEPRYKLMMTRIVNASRAFAYVSTHHELAPGAVALVAELKEAEFLADGRCILEATLSKRCRVVEHYVEEGTQGLHYCRLDPFRDETGPAERQDALQALKTHAVALVEQLLPAGRTRRMVEDEFGPMPASDPEQFSMWFASISPLTQNEHVLALHSRDTFDRLQTCVQRVEAYLAQRQRGGRFPVATALGATITTALSALLGSAQAAGSGVSVARVDVNEHLPSLVEHGGAGDTGDGESEGVVEEGLVHPTEAAAASSGALSDEDEAP